MKGYGPGDLQKYIFLKKQKQKQIPAFAHTQTSDTGVVRAILKEKP